MSKEIEQDSKSPCYECMDKAYCDYLDWVENKYKARRELDQIYSAIINRSNLATFNKYFMPLSKLDDIRTEIEQIPSELTADGRRIIRREDVFQIIDKYKKEDKECGKKC